MQTSIRVLLIILILLITIIICFVIYYKIIKKSKSNKCKNKIASMYVTGNYSEIDALENIKCDDGTYLTDVKLRDVGKEKEMVEFGKFTLNKPNSFTKKECLGKYASGYENIDNKIYITC